MTTQPPEHSVTITLSSEEIVSMDYLFDMAEKGREDFVYQAEYGGDYSPEDIETAQKQWDNARQLMIRLLNDLDLIK